jgi:hypothetical protein
MALIAVLPGFTCCGMEIRGWASRCVVHPLFFLGSSIFTTSAHCPALNGNSEAGARHVHSVLLYIFSAADIEITSLVSHPAVTSSLFSQNVFRSGPLYSNGSYLLLVVADQAGHMSAYGMRLFHVPLALFCRQGRVADTGFILIRKHHHACVGPEWPCCLRWARSRSWRAAQLPGVLFLGMMQMITMCDDTVEMSSEA